MKKLLSVIALALMSLTTFAQQLSFGDIAVKADVSTIKQQLTDKGYVAAGANTFKGTYLEAPVKITVISGEGGIGSEIMVEMEDQLKSTVSMFNRAVKNEVKKQYPDADMDFKEGMQGIDDTIFTLEDGTITLNYKSYNAGAKYTLTVHYKVK